MYCLCMYLSAGPADEAAPGTGSLSLGEVIGHNDEPRSSILSEKADSGWKCLTSKPLCGELCRQHLLMNLW